jgi:hypothetical protein
MAVQMGDPINFYAVRQLQGEAMLFHLSAIILAVKAKK